MVERVKKGSVVLKKSVLKDNGSSWHKKKLAKMVAHLTEDEALRLIHKLEVHPIELESLSEDRFRIFSETSPSFIIVFQKDSFIYVNPAAIDLLGYSEEEVFRKKFWEFIHPDDLEMVKQRGFARQMGEEVPDRYEVRVISKQGKIIWIDYSSRIITLNNEPAVLGIGIDISQRKQAEKELIKAKRDLDQFLNLIPDLIVVASLDGYFKIINPEWEKVLGYTSEELLGKPFESFIHPDDIEATRHEVERQSKGKSTVSFQNRYRHKDGSYRWFEWKATPVIENLLYGAARDITEQKVAEDVLLKKTEELEYLNSHFVNREHKMIELKKEINELLVKQGGKEKYVIHR